MFWSRKFWLNFQKKNSHRQPLQNYLESSKNCVLFPAGCCLRGESFMHVWIIPRHSQGGCMTLALPLSYPWCRSYQLNDKYFMATCDRSFNSIAIQQPYHSIKCLSLNYAILINYKFVINVYLHSHLALTFKDGKEYLPSPPCVKWWEV